MELVIILLVLVLLFGATRLKDLGGSLGQGIKEFRTAVKDEEEETPTQTNSTQNTAAQSPEAAPAAPVSTNGGEAITAVKCSNCGALNESGAKHCNQCGTALAAPVT